MNDEMNPITPDNEIATPRCEAERFEALEGSALRRDCVKLSFARQLERELAEKTNEVARLRELLNRAIETARTFRKLAFINSDDYCDWHFEDRTKAANDFADLCKEVSQLAPAAEEPKSAIPPMAKNSPGDTCPVCGSPEIEAMTPATVYKCGSSDLDGRPNTFKRGKDCTPTPEEPANPTCSNIAHKFSHCDCKEPSEKDTSTESCPSQKDTEWRDLLPDELICEGDEYYTGKWTKITGWIGYPASNFARVRTCRKPLDEELKDIDQYADKQNDFYTCRVFQSIEYSLHYLRDEIQKLKEAR